MAMSREGERWARKERSIELAQPEDTSQTLARFNGGSVCDDERKTSKEDRVVADMPTEGQGIGGGIVDEEPEVGDG